MDFGLTSIGRNYPPAYWAWVEIWLQQKGNGLQIFFAGKGVWKKYFKMLGLGCKENLTHTLSFEFISYSAWNLIVQVHIIFF